jgi:hypothetical protein
LKDGSNATPRSPRRHRPRKSLAQEAVDLNTIGSDNAAGPGSDFASDSGSEAADLTDPIFQDTELTISRVVPA